MKITVNGQEKYYYGPPWMTSLLESLSFSTRPVVVERNLRVVSRNELDKEPVEDGDIIEIIRFVGGG